MENSILYRIQKAVSDGCQAIEIDPLIHHDGYGVVRCNSHAVLISDQGGDIGDHTNVALNQEEEPSHGRVQFGEDYMFHVFTRITTRFMEELDGYGVRCLLCGGACIRRRCTRQ